MEVFKIKPRGNTPGYYLANSLKVLDFSSLSSSKVNEVYFKTSSGNIYRIYFSKNEFGHPNGLVLTNSRHSKNSYLFNDGEERYGRLEVGKPFVYGKGGNTTDITEIIQVNTNTKYLNMDKVPTAKLPLEFWKCIEIRNVINKF